MQLAHSNFISTISQDIIAYMFTLCLPISQIFILVAGYCPAGGVSFVGNGLSFTEEKSQNC